MATATKAAIAKHRLELEEARRLAALQVDTLAHAVTSVDDQVGWTRLTELGTTSTVRAQEAGVTSTVDMLNRTLEAVDMVGDFAARLPGVEPGRLASGRSVVGMFAKTQNIVQARMAGGATFPEGLDASANVLTAIASSEPHRIARDGPFNVGLSDSRFNRYRRVAVGVTCAFCRMLATRGAVYLTPESAGRGRQYHYKCDCYVELVADPAAIERSKVVGAEQWRRMQGDSATAFTPGGSTTRAFTPNAAAVAGTPERAASLRRQRDLLVKQRADGTLTPWGEQRIADIDAEILTSSAPFRGVTVDAPGVGMADAHLADFELIPEPIRAKVADAGVQVRIVDGPFTDAYPEFRGVRPRGWPAGSSWDDIPGAYHHAERVVVVGEVPGQRGHGSHSLMTHEYGHAVDKALKVSGSSLSNSGAYSRAYHAVDWTDPYLMQGGVAGYEESFAEVFSLMVGGGDASAVATNPAAVQDLWEVIQTLVREAA